MTSAISDDIIRDRVYGRQAAIAAVELADVSTLRPESLRAFWEHLAKLAAENLPQPEPPADDAMTDAQAEAFGRWPMPYGKHEGEPIASVPSSYLTWLAEEADEFKAKLRRYLKSPAVRRQIAEENDTRTEDQEP